MLGSSDLCDKRWCGNDNHEMGCAFDEAESEHERQRWQECLQSGHGGTEQQPCDQHAAKTCARHQKTCHKTKDDPQKADE